MHFQYSLNTAELVHVVPKKKRRGYARPYCQFDAMWRGEGEGGGGRGGQLVYNFTKYIMVIPQKSAGIGPRFGTKKRRL